MNRFLVCVALAAIAVSPNPAWAGVAIQVGQPGFYGTLDIGGFPQPQIIYPQPVVIQPVPAGVVAAPIYLHVPPGQAKNWRKHCGHYNVCGQPVYFVQDSWYNQVYVPHYREMHGNGHKPHGKGHDHDNDD